MPTSDNGYVHAFVTSDLRDECIAVGGTGHYSGIDWHDKRHPLFLLQHMHPAPLPENTKHRQEFVRFYMLLSNCSIPQLLNQ